MPLVINILAGFALVAPVQNPTELQVPTAEPTVLTIVHLLLQLVRFISSF